MDEDRNLTKRKKTRVGGQGVPKVKSGCLTCKIRHKKCDEAKPACLRCVDTGRKCDFLSLVFRSPSPRQAYYATAYRSDIRLAMYPRLHYLDSLNDFELMHFEYFRTICAKEFSLFFDVESWERTALQAVFTEPCILHAALAVSALSRSHYLPDESQYSSSQAESHVEYAIREYNLAIRGLNNRLDSSSRSWELAILGSIFFITIEVLQGYVNLVRMHLQSAFSMWKSHSNTVPPAATCKVPGPGPSSGNDKNTSGYLGSPPDLDFLFSALLQIDAQVSSIARHETYRIARLGLEEE